ADLGQDVVVAHLPGDEQIGVAHALEQGAARTGADGDAADWPFYAWARDAQGGDAEQRFQAIGERCERRRLREREQAPGAGVRAGLGLERVDVPGRFFVRMMLGDRSRGDGELGTSADHLEPHLVYQLELAALTEHGRCRVVAEKGALPLRAEAALAIVADHSGVRPGGQRAT